MPIFLLLTLVPKTSLDYVHHSRAGLLRWRGLLISKTHDNIFKNLGGLHEIPSASRPCRGQAYRRRRRQLAALSIPDSAKEKPSQGEITAVGPGGRDEAGKLIPIDLKVGDRVLFGKWSGTEVKLDGQELLIMKESDIMGVLTDLPAAKKKAA